MPCYTAASSLAFGEITLQAGGRLIPAACPQLSFMVTPWWWVYIWQGFCKKSSFRVNYTCKISAWFPMVRCFAFNEQGHPTLGEGQFAESRY